MRKLGTREIYFTNVVCRWHIYGFNWQYRWVSCFAQLLSLQLGIKVPAFDYGSGYPLYFGMMPDSGGITYQQKNDDQRDVLPINNEIGPCRQLDFVS